MRLLFAAYTCYHPERCTHIPLVSTGQPCKHVVNKRAPSVHAVHAAVHSMAHLIARERDRATAHAMPQRCQAAGRRGYDRWGRQRTAVAQQECATSFSADAEKPGEIPEIGHHVPLFVAKMTPRKGKVGWTQEYWRIWGAIWGVTPDTTPYSKRRLSGGGINKRCGVQILSTRIAQTG